MRLFITCLFCLFIVTQSVAQKNRFGAGVFTGLNFSQINDDRHQGYSKIGLTTGLKGVINLKTKFDIAVELAYNQRGSKSGEIDNDRISSGIHPFNLSLSYYDIGVFPGIYLYQSYDDFYRLRVSAGITYGRLANASVKETIFQLETSEPQIVFEEVAENATNSEINFSFGCAFYLQKDFGIELRHTNALNSVYTDDNRKFVQYFLTLRAFYNFL